MLYGDSPWDTKVVGEPVAVIKYLVATGEDDSRVLDQLLDEVLRHAAGRGIHLLTCKVQPLQFAAIHALERHGFLLMDTLLDFFFDFSRTPFDKINPPQRLDGLQLRLANPEDLPELLALTETAFAKHFGRYNSDPKMPAGTGTKVYQEWVRSSFNGAADWILIAEVNDQDRWLFGVEKGVCTGSKTFFRHCALHAGSYPSGFFWTRSLYDAHFRKHANGAKIREAPRRAGACQSLSRWSSKAKARLEDCRRKTFFSQMAHRLTVSIISASLLNTEHVSTLFIELLASMRIQGCEHAK